MILADLYEATFKSSRPLCKLLNGLDYFKVAHNYPDTLGIPINSTLKEMRMVNDCGGVYGQLTTELTRVEMC